MPEFVNKYFIKKISDLKSLFLSLTSLFTIFAREINSGKTWLGFIEKLKNMFPKFYNRICFNKTPSTLHAIIDKIWK